MTKKIIRTGFFLSLSCAVFFLLYAFLPRSIADKGTKNHLLSEEIFKNPGKNHYPETWFHFIGGNVSKEGITADLEAIAAAKISGIQLFHGQFGGEWPGVSPQIRCLSESWDELIEWTAQECRRLGLHFTMQNCPGWSYAGGPWIEPENAMRHLAFSRTDIDGGRDIGINLPPPQVSGEAWRDYRDLFVIAFPTPSDDTGKELVPANIRSNCPDIPWADCLLHNKAITLSPSPTAPVSVDIEFEEETTVRTIEFPAINSFSHPWCYSPGVTVTAYAMKNGVAEQIARLDMPQASWQDDKPISIACREVPSKQYRVQISNQHDMRLSFIRFYSAARRQNWESEAAWTLRRIVRETHPEQSASTWVSSAKILNLTDKMAPDGTFSWNAPQGRWTILRIGHYNTGMKNGPAPEEATGWECNKLDVNGARANFDGYIGRLLNEGKLSLKNGLLQGILIDSWECRTQTWTSGLDSLFREKWNYSLFPMFPALFGYVVDEPETTARFLRDWRVTLNDLLVHNFFGEMKKLAQENSLRLAFETASGDIFPGDIMEYYKYADIPMCEFWQPRMDSFVGSDEFKPLKPCVSAARLYGKKRVAAEAFTSFNLTWDEHPRYLKSIIDYHFSQGVTHPVFHTFTHNPRTDFLPPGTSFGSGIGTPFLRLQTWWQQMPAFTDYLARCNYMLEYGHPVSDVLMYLGDEQNHKPPQSLPFPAGFSYDYCNPDVLLNRLSVKDGRMITPEGNSYRVLWLYDCKRMLPETLEKILSFVRQGVILVGERPENLATLSGGEKAAMRFGEMVNEIWGSDNEAVRSKGKGKIYTGDVFSALVAEKIKPDVAPDTDEVNWLHRQSAEADLYYLSVSSEKGFNGAIAFRSAGFAEIWNPLTGEITNIRSKRTSKEYTEVSLNIPSGTSLFVVFRKKEIRRRNYAVQEEERQEINSPWQIRFPSGWDISSDPILLSGLTAWKNLPLGDAGKAFSGTAAYNTTFIFDKSENKHYLLDLGRVEYIAQVKLNGEEIGTIWTAPYRIEITKQLKTGENHLEIAVTSTWHNRLAFDAALPENQRKTWTISPPGSDSKMKEYGLLGPVSVIPFH